MQKKNDDGTADRLNVSCIQFCKMSSDKTKRFRCTISRITCDAIRHDTTKKFWRRS